MLISPIKQRVEMLDLVDCVDENGILIFPEEIKIISFTKETDDRVRIVLDRRLEAENSATISITDSALYNGEYSINDIASDKLSLSILSAFNGDDTGYIMNTGHKYKDTEETEIKNFPAVLIEIDNTSFDSGNAENMLICSNVFSFQVIDSISKYSNTRKITSLEAAQDFVWNKGVEILGKISDSDHMVLEIDKLEIYETIADKDKKCACMIARIEITNR